MISKVCISFPSLLIFPMKWVKHFDVLLLGLSSHIFFDFDVSQFHYIFIFIRNVHSPKNEMAKLLTYLLTYSVEQSPS